MSGRRALRNLPRILFIFVQGVDLITIINIVCYFSYFIPQYLSILLSHSVIFEAKSSLVMVGP